ncbi:MAG: hypothetical protein ACRED0_02370 [Gammaproteobacteria bacterium]
MIRIQITQTVLHSIYAGLYLDPMSIKKQFDTLWSFWEGERGGKRAAFSTASAPVRRRRIVHKSTAGAGLGAAVQPDKSWGLKPVGKRMAYGGSLSS